MNVQFKSSRWVVVLSFWIVFTLGAFAQTWTGVDIGSVGVGGSNNYNSSTGVYTMRGSGSDIGAATDGCHFVYQTISGDGELEARVVSVQNTDTKAKVGVMVRNTLDNGSVEAMVAQTYSSGVLWQQRTTVNATGVNQYTANSGAPWWVRIVKDGGIITGYQSPDGVNWTYMGVTRLNFTGPVEIGLVVCSHSNTHLCTATFDNVSLQTQANFAAPAPWVDQDIGATVQLGGVHYENTTWTVYGSGSDIFGTVDAFHYAYQPLNGDGSIVAQVSGIANTNGWAKAGVMIRSDLTAGSANVLAAITPSNGVTLQARSTAGGTTTSAVGASVTAPYWLKLTRSGNQFYIYESADGSTWQQFGTQTVSMPTQVYIGLAESSHTSNALTTGFFNNVQILSAALQINSKTDTSVNLIWPSLASPSQVALYQIFRNGAPVGTSTTTNFNDIQLTPSTTYSYFVQALNSSNTVLATSSTLSVTTDSPWLPSPWTHLDIGAVLLGGSSQFDSPTSTFTLQGSGADITGTADAFQFAEQALSGDGQIIARVKSVSPTNGWTKAGIMFRETNAAGSRHAMITVTPSNGVNFERRITTGGTSALTAGSALTAPVWLKLIRQGSVISSYSSADGINWALVGNDTVAMNTVIEAGLVLASHSPNALASATMDNVSVTASVPTETQPPSVPSAVTQVAVSDVADQIQWNGSTDSVGVTGYQVFRNGQFVITTANLTYTDTGLTPSQSYSYTVKAVNFGSLVSAASASLTVTTQALAVPSPWLHQEIGAIALVGSASGTGNSFNLSASGGDIWGSVDAFGFIYKPLNGDGQITAQVTSLQNTNPWAKAGVMIRQSLDPGSPYAAMLVTPSSGLAFQTRSVQGGNSSTQAGSLVTAPIWVQLVRHGSVLSGYSSVDGINWTLVAQQTLSLTSSVYVGMAVTSHTNNALCTATFYPVYQSASTSNTDTDFNGLPDWWELQYFGHLGNNASSSPDGNGLTLLQDYQQGNDPTNYYSQGGQIITTVLAIVSGNSQTSVAGSFAPQPLVVKVTNSSGTALVNAPVTFTITSGGGLVATTTGGSGSSSLVARTVSTGQAQAYYQQSTGVNVTSQISATTGNQSASFSETSTTATAAPTFTPGAGTYTTQQTVTITSATPGTTIYYTTDGSTPTTSSSSVASGGTVLVAQSEVVKVMAVVAGQDPSAIAAAFYQIQGKTIVAAGGGFTLALRSDGTVWAWGVNGAGQLGNGTRTNSSSPVQVTGMSGVVAVAAGGEHSLALKSDGTVWEWGGNELGQLGNGTSAGVSSPIQVSGLSGVVAVAAGEWHSLAIKSDGTVWAWGYDNSGELGNGTTAFSSNLVQVSNLIDVVAVAAGGEHSVAVKSDGTVWAWGLNASGQLGNGTTTDSSIPVQVTGLTNVVTVAAGMYHNLVIKNDGTLWAWGYNGYGELGNGTTITATSPIQITGLNGVVAIAGGELHSVALKSDGTIWAWGNDQDGETGETIGIGESSPVQVAGLSGMVSVAAGASHSVAVKSDGTVWAWGDNSVGELANGTTPSPSASSPIQVSGLSGMTKIAAGSSYNLILKNNGTVWAWGNNSIGQLGNGTTASSISPVLISGFSGVVAVAAATDHSLAIKSNGTVWAWGDNQQGQLGNGTTTNSSNPVQVSGLNNVVSVDAGNWHNLALKSDGTVWAWGLNAWGQLGNGTITDSSSPVQVIGMSGVVAVAVGSYGNSLALKSDGTVWAWGLNNWGQLGNGTMTNASSPVQVSGLSGVIAIAAGTYHSLALKSDGTVWAWGYDQDGELGNGTLNYTGVNSPVQVSNLNGVVAIAGGYANSLAIKNDGTVWTWGANWYGELGNGTTTGSTIPVEVNNLTGVVAVAAGDYHSLALKGDGTITTWGGNFNGELGDGEILRSYMPLSVNGLNLTGPFPTVSITAPTSGVTIVLGQTAHFQVAAAAGSGQISKVEYYNEGIKIGESDTEPFSINWTVPTWGDFHISAVATNNQGALSTQSPVVTIHVPFDSDNNSLPDWWELKYFGQIDNNPSSSPDGNGLTLLQDYQQGNDPTNYYSQSGQTITPILTIVSGNNQTSAAGTFAPQPLVVKVTDSNNNPLFNAPVTFTADINGGLVAPTVLDTPSSVLLTPTDINGHAQVYYQQPSSNNISSQVTTTTASQSVSFSEETATAAIPYTFSTLAGLAGNIGSADGTGSAATFYNPDGVAVDASGTVYVADTQNSTIRKITPGGVVTTLAGVPGSFGSADGPGSAAMFDCPYALAVDASGNLYVADLYNDTIRKVTPAGVVTTLAGLAGTSGSADGTGSAARFNGPDGIALDANGNLYVADLFNNTIRKIAPSGVVTTLAGLAGNFGSADGTGNAARFNDPIGIAVDANGNVYVGDSNNNTIRKITPAGVVTTLAGLAGNFGSMDGTGSAARFTYPSGLAIDASSNVYVADWDNSTIRKITPAGVVTTLGGTANNIGSADGTGSAASFYNPIGVAADAVGNVYVADTHNNTIRFGTPYVAAATPTFSPGAGTYASAQTVTITSTTSGATIHYTVDGSTPSVTSPVATGGVITVSTSETVKAIAIATGYNNSAVASAIYTIQVPTAPPTFSPAPGTYTSPLTVTISCATTGATIYYTIDGSVPTTSSSSIAAGGTIVVGASETIKAFAVAPGYNPSPISSGAYTIQVPAATPTFNPGAGTYTSAQTVTITSTTPNATIYYTTDGSMPTTSSTSITSSGTISVAVSEMVKAIAVATGFNNSAVASAAYVIQVPAATPTFSPGAGTYTSAQTVTITSATPSATIYYTTDGSTPTTSSTSLSSGGTISVAVNETVKAIAVATGFNNSAVASAAYVIQVPAATPTFSPAAGTYTSAQTVTITSTTPSATIYYTTDGSTPTTSSASISSGATITISASETVKALAVATGFNNSAVASAAYTIQVPAATPTFSPAAGTFTSAQTVTIASTTPSATIYYTTDNSIPTTSSASIASGGTISVVASETVKAIAVATGFNNSAVASAAYVIQVPAATPTFSPGAGTYTSAQTVTITSTTPSAAIYYTTNGSTPTTSSTSITSGGTISVAVSETVKAIAVATGFNNSAVASAAYTIQVPAATPTFSPAAGTYTSPQTVAITSTTPSAIIYYTTDNSTPTTSSASITSGGTISVAVSETVKAIAGATGFNNSAVASAAYTIQVPAATPTFSPGAGTYTSAQTVTIISATSGSTIYYTTNGTTPTTSSASIASGGMISVAASETVKAMAVATGFNNSGVASAAYVIQVPAATPTFSPGAGTYTSAQTVTITSATSGSTIYYTTNGATPTTSSASIVSGGTITVSVSETVKAMAVAIGFNNSAVASAAYTIQTAAAPTFSLGAGTYTTSQVIALNSTTSGATIYYTTNGTAPTTASPSVASGSTIVVAQSETVQAMAVATGFANSSIASAVYTILVPTGPAEPFAVSIAATGPFQTPANPLIVTNITHPASTTIVSVAFYQGSALLGTATKAPYQFVCSNLQPGFYTITALATASDGTTATSTTQFRVTESNYYTRGQSADSVYDSSIIAVDFEQGQLLDGKQNTTSSNYSSLYAATQYPWFLRTKAETNELWKDIASVTNGVPTYGTFGVAPTVNGSSVGGVPPLVAFGSQGGGTSLYTNQSYNFGMAAGGQLVFAPIKIVSISGTGTFTTATNHGLTARQLVILSGITTGAGNTPDTDLTGSFLVGASPGATTFTLTTLDGGAVTLPTGTYNANSGIINTSAITISSVTNSTGVLTTATNHGLKTGQMIVINGATVGANKNSDAALTGTFVVGTVTTNTLTLKTVSGTTVSLVGTGSYNVSSGLITNPDIKVEVYRASDFTSGANNVAPIYTQGFTVPNPGNLTAWNAFINNGYVQDYHIVQVDGSNTIDFDTQVQLQSAPGVTTGETTSADTAATETWGQQVDYALLVTHRAANPLYYYKVSYMGVTATDNAGANSTGVDVPSSAADFPLAVDSTGTNQVYNVDYTLDFTAPSSTQSAYISQPQFQETPLPPADQGMSVEELVNNSPQVQDVLDVPGSALGFSAAALTSVDNSPELRDHPVLDQFVTSMNNDPIALANYVLNEINLTDAVGYSPTTGQAGAPVSDSLITSVTNSVLTTAAPHNLYPGEMISISGVTGALATALNNTFLVGSTPTSTTLTLTSVAAQGGTLTFSGAYAGSGLINSVNTSINPQGIRRDAMATFLEGQGSPAEQCALLVYLLRKANVPCGYIFPNQDQMLMIDQQLSSLLRMQIQGQNGPTGPLDIPQLIPVNYPWVAAYINVNGTNQWVHIFPWLKNTVLNEGPNIWNYLPSGYQSGSQWILNYVMDDPSIRQLTTPGGLYTDDVNTLFPLYVQQHLQGTTLSIDQLGMTAYNQQNYYTRWQDFPHPWQTPVVTDANMAQNLDYTKNPSVLSPALQGIFDTVHIQVASDENNNGLSDSGEPAIDTGTLNLVDLHDRRFLLYHTVTSSPGSNSPTYKMTLSLEAYGDPLRTNSNTYTFNAGSSADNASGHPGDLMNKQIVSVPLNSSDDALLYRVTYSLHQQAQVIPNVDSVNNWQFFLGVQETTKLDDTRHLRKGDMACLCLDYGQVTQQMEEFQAEKYWNYQQTVAAANNPAAVADPELAEGQLLYLMGDSYYYKVSGLLQNIDGWTKTNVVTFLGHGLSKLSPLRDSSGNLVLSTNNDLLLCYPRVDMLFDESGFIGNGTDDLNSGDTGNIASDNANELLIGGGSAFEHLTINQFFKQDAAISTIRLLDIAQGWTPGAPVAVIGNAVYTGGGTIASPALSITGATYDGINPALITTSAAHGLNVGQTITISSVAGDTGLNGTFVVASLPSSTTFTLRTNASTGVATHPKTGPIELTASTYTAAGAVTYTSGSATKTLKDWCGPTLWSQITKPFADKNKGPLSVVYVTPGPVIATAVNQTVTGNVTTQQYTGMGALFLGVGNYAAYISNNLIINGGNVYENGGAGFYDYNPIGVLTLTYDQVGNISLSGTPSGDYSLSFPSGNSFTSLIGSTNPPSSFLSDTYSANDLGSLNIGLTNGSLVVNSQQLDNLSNFNNEFNYNGTLGGIPSANLSNFGSTTGALTLQMASDGNIGSLGFDGAMQSSLDTVGSGYSLAGIGTAIYDPVNSMTGEFYVNALDIKLNGPMPLEIRRIYGSQNLATNSFGYNWRLSYFPYLELSSDAAYNTGNTQLTTLPTIIYAAEMDGSVIAYKQQTTPTIHWSPTAADNPNLANSGGGSVGSTNNPFNNRIDPVTSGSATTGFTLTGADGSVRTFAVLAYPTSGSVVVSRARPYLQKWTDNRGNYYTFGFGTAPTSTDYGQVNSIKSSNGDFVGFNYNTDGNITEAFTGDGRFLYYQYDAFGDLTQVTLPDASTISYNYQHVISPAVAGKTIDSSILTSAYAANSGIITNDNNIPISSVNTSTGVFATASANHLVVGDVVVIGGAKTTAANNPPYTAINGTFTVGSVSGNTFTLITGAVSAGPESTHLITQETKPDGRILQNTYDGTGRVLSQSATVGSNQTLVQNASFNYGTPVKNADGTYTGSTVITDVNGNKTTYQYQNSQITEVDSPVPNGLEKGTTATQSVIQTWCQASDVTAGIAPAGYYARCLKHHVDARNLVTDYTYDANGNLLTLKLTGDLLGTGGTSDTSTTTMAYNTTPVALPGGTSIAPNTLASVIDQLGNGTRYTYGNSAYPYQPTSIAKITAGVTISTSLIQYQNVSGNGVSAYGLVQQQTVASGTPDQAVCQYTYNGNGFPTSKTELTGTNDPSVVTNYTYDLRGEITSQTDAAGRSTQFRYDALGHPASMERYDEWGNLVSWNFTYYNQSGDVIWEQGPRYSPNDYIYKQYNGAGQVSQEVKWLSGALADGSGVTATGYATTTYQHDTFGNLIEIDDPNQNATVMVYDAVGNMTGRTVHAGSSTGSAVLNESYTYDPNGQVLTHTDMLGGHETRKYTSTGKLESDTMPDGTNKSFQYDATGRVTRETLTNGSFWTTTYNDQARTVTRVLQSGGTQLMQEVKAYDRRGNVISKTDVSGNTFVTTYDSLNRVKTSVGPPAAGSTAQQKLFYVYDAAGVVNTVTNGAGERTVSFTDALGRPTLVSVYNADGTAASNTGSWYSPDHQSVVTTVGSGAANSANPAVTTTTYTDTRGHVVLLKHADGTWQGTTYDANGNTTSFVDEQGATSVWTYDALNRVASEALPASAGATPAVTSYMYTLNSPGETVIRTMPESLKAQTVYDSAGRKTEEELDGSGGAVNRKYTYNYYSSNGSGGVKGFLSQVVDPRGFTTTTTYDAWMRPASVVSSGASTAQQNQNTTYGYDNRGMVNAVVQSYAASATGASTQVLRGYDAYGHINAETVSVNANGVTTFNSGNTVSQWAQSWDTRGRRSALNFQLAVQTPGVAQYAYQYNANGQLTGVSSAGFNFSYGYGDNGMLQQRTSPFLNSTVTQRDNRGRVVTQNVGGVLSEMMAYRSDSRLSSYQVSGPLYNETRNYDNYDGHGSSGYNLRGQLLEEPYLLNNSTSGQLTGQQLAQYLFDQTTIPSLANGNEGGLGVRTLQYVNSSIGNQVTAQNSLGQVTQDNYAPQNSVNGTINYSYDLAGNVTNRAFYLGTTSTGFSQNLTWDAHNRLTGVRLTSSQGTAYNWTTVYDGFGRRVQTNLLQGTTSNSVTYYYDPQVEFLELGHDNGGRTWNVFGPDKSGSYGGAQGIGGLDGVIVESNGGAYGSINDYFGDAVGVSTGGVSQAWSATLGLGGYGELPGTSVNTALQAQWRGHYEDWTGVVLSSGSTPVSTFPGFYYMGARYYDPSSGRFLSADPMGHSGSMDLYSYCHGDPVNGLDPDGRLGKGLLEAVGVSPQDADDILQPYAEAADAVNEVVGGFIQLAGQILGNPRVQGGLRAIGGVTEMIAGATFGAATSWTGIGAVAGGVVVLHGADEFQSGLRQLWSGEQTDSFTSQGLQGLGLSENTANLVDGGISLVGTGGTAALTKFGSFAAEEATTFDQIASKIQSGDFSTPRNGAVFWSSSDNMEVAQQWAAANGKFTVEMTPGGQELDDLQLFGENSPVTREQASTLWNMASTKFAQGASGRVNAFTIGTDTVNDAGRTFYRLELPLLKSNPAVNPTITYRGY